MVDLSIVMLVYQRIQRAFWDVNPTPWNSGECWLLPISGVDGSLGVQDKDDPDQRVDVHGVVFLSETDRYGISVTKTWSLTNTNCSLRTDFCGLKKIIRPTMTGDSYKNCCWWSSYDGLCRLARIISLAAVRSVKNKLRSWHRPLWCPQDVILLWMGTLIGVWPTCEW